MRAGFYILISFSFIFSCYLQSKIKYSEFNPKALPFENDINAIYFTQKNKQVELGIILKKCADYCQKLSHSVLYFVCQEKIEEEIFHYPFISFQGGETYFLNRPDKVERNNYIYDYQLIKRGSKIEESRILLAENGQKKHEKKAGLKTKRFYSKRSVLGPVGLLSKYWQDKYNYRIIKEEVLSGQRAIVVEALPKVKMREKPNYGRVWVDKKDFSILKIEIRPESLADFRLFEKEAAKFEAVPDISVSHYYGIEKNGIRFPSQTVFEENYISRKLAKRFKKSKTVITYDNYRFFTVEVEVKY